MRKNFFMKKTEIKGLKRERESRTINKYKLYGFPFSAIVIVVNSLV
jgi:hypothetical protein